VDPQYVPLCRSHCVHACRVPQVKQVACGGMHSLVLTEGGEVWMWGEPWGDFSLYLDRHPRKVRAHISVFKLEGVVKGLVQKKRTSGQHTKYA